MGEVHQRNCALFPHRVAILFEGRETSFAEYYDRSLRLANALLERGVAFGDRVAMLAMNCVEYVEFYGACEFAGFIAVGINFRLAVPEVAYVLSDSAPAALIFEEQYRNLVEGLRGELPDNLLFICIGNAPDWGISHEEMIDSAALGLPPIRPALDDPLSILYTSGTTGRAKGALRTNRADAYVGEIYAQELNLEPPDRMLIMMPLFHAGGRGMQLAIFWRGATMVLHRGADPGAMLRSIERDRVTVTHMAPTIFQDLLDHPDATTRDLRSLRTLLYAAAPMPVPLLERGLALLGCIFVNGYGCSEAVGCMLRKEDHILNGSRGLRKRLKSVGQPLIRAEARIVDEQGQPLSAGEIGEIVLRSDGMLTRYWNNDVATAEALRGGWFHTGDMAYADDQGFITLVDRKKDVIISGGENIYSREVEECLLRHSAVADVAVIGVPDARWGESVCAIVVTKTDMTATVPELIDHSRAMIARYKAPKAIIFVDCLPRLDTGKVDKVALRRLYGHGSAG